MRRRPVAEFVQVMPGGAGPFLDNPSQPRSGTVDDKHCRSRRFAHTSFKLECQPWRARAVADDSFVLR